MAEATVGPQKSADRRIQEFVRAGTIMDLPAYEVVFRQASERARAIDDDRDLTPQAKADRRRKVLADANEQGSKILDAALKDQLRESEQQEGSARAAARRDDLTRERAFQTTDEARAEDRSYRRERVIRDEWRFRLASVETETDPAELEAMAAELVEQETDDAGRFIALHTLSGNAVVTATALRVLVQRADVLATKERRKNPTHVSFGPAQEVHQRLAGLLTRWRAANPTPAQRIRAARSARTAARMRLEQSAQVYRRLYGFERHDYTIGAVGR